MRKVKHFTCNRCNRKIKVSSKRKSDTIVTTDLGVFCCDSCMWAYTLSVNVQEGRHCRISLLTSRIKDFKRFGPYFKDDKIATQRIATQTLESQKELLHLIRKEKQCMEMEDASQYIKDKSVRFFEMLSEKYDLNDLLGI